MCDRPTPIFSMMAVGNVVPLQFGAHDVAIYTACLNFVRSDSRSSLVPEVHRIHLAGVTYVRHRVCVEDYEIGALAFYQHAETQFWATSQARLLQRRLLI